MIDDKPTSVELCLGHAPRGFKGTIIRLSGDRAQSSLEAGELELQLNEMGFAEGSLVEVLHVGPVGKDPIAVRVDNVTIALRRREAMAILVSERT
jgi:ferrous iron transport protein A